MITARQLILSSHPSRCPPLHSVEKVKALEKSNIKLSSKPDLTKGDDGSTCFFVLAAEYYCLCKHEKCEFVPS